MLALLTETTEVEGAHRIPHVPKCLRSRSLRVNWALQPGRYEKDFEAKTWKALQRLTVQAKRLSSKSDILIVSCLLWKGRSWELTRSNMSGEMACASELRVAHRALFCLRANLGVGLSTPGFRDRCTEGSNGCHAG